MAWSAAASNPAERSSNQSRKGVGPILVTSRAGIADMVTQAAHDADLDVRHIRSGDQLLGELVSSSSPCLLVLDMDSVEPAIAKLAVEVVRRFSGRLFHFLFLGTGALAPRVTLSGLPPSTYDVVGEPIRQSNLTSLLAHAAFRLDSDLGTREPSDAAGLITRALRDAQRLITSVEALHCLAGTSAEQRDQKRTQLDHLAAVIRARRARARLFGEELFADPAWDMLLDLFDHHLRGQKVTVSSLCIAAAVPQTTALRRLDEMIKAKLVMKERDPADGRRIFVRLSSGAAEKMQVLLDQYGLLS